jgi:hypothetical protein
MHFIEIFIYILRTAASPLRTPTGGPCSAPHTLAHTVRNPSVTPPAITPPTLPHPDVAALPLHMRSAAPRYKHPEAAPNHAPATHESWVDTQVLVRVPRRWAPGGNSPP